MKLLFCLLLFTSSILTPHKVNGQKNTFIVQDLEELIQKEKYKEADAILAERIPQLIASGNKDTLVYYPYYIGVIETNLKNKKIAKQSLLTFLKNVKQKYPIDKILFSCNIEVANFFFIEGDFSSAYDLVKETESYFSNKLPKEDEEHVLLKIKLGVYAADQGNYTLAANHYRSSLIALKQLNSKNYELYFKVYNSMGITMWYASKLDSTVYFFKEAEKVLLKTDSSAVNRYFRPAMLQNNIANAYNGLGQSTNSIKELETAIYNYKTFIALPEDFPQKKNALIQQFRSLDNLAKNYIDLGNYSKGLQLLQYSYQQKLKNFAPDNAEIYKSLIYLGTLYNQQQDHTKAIQTLSEALHLIRTTGKPGTTLWEAETLTHLGYCYADTKEPNKAIKHLQEADIIYKKMLGSEFSIEYLTYLSNAANIYANNNLPKLALELSKSGTDYVLKNNDRESILTIDQMVNQALLNYTLKNYEESIKQSETSIKLINKVTTKSLTLIDSIHSEINKPKAILIKAKSLYALTPIKTEENINRLLIELKGAIDILEKRKQILTDNESMRSLLPNYMSIVDFMKELELELYNLSYKSNKLDTILHLHESGIYTKIRSQLDKQNDNLKFIDIPEEILQQESILKQELEKSLTNNKAHAKNVDAYLLASKKLNNFQEELKRKYPKYYALRYAQKEAIPAQTIANSIDQKTSLVRFLFINEKLYAYVIEKEKQKWIYLPIKNIKESINKLSSISITQEEACILSYDLYQQLWQPLEKQISNKRVIIIPDDVLYYLSFDMLASQPVTSYQKLAQHSLVNKYAISYHYSTLAMMQPKNKEKINRKGDYVAFTPGFDDLIKLQYKKALKNDSLRIDHSYLSLLPLPFSINLVEEYNKKFSGNIFSGISSTQGSFKKNAGNHAIIHIGTHAEANNQYPEYSRLIFAKDLDNPTSDNSLYLFDIYNYDLKSDLAVLTACETGKPGFFPGEGMISMAHAFNYAGSESILTGLWKIDEQASTMITQFFYDNLANGMTKDEALRQAKLTYLSTAEGRMLAPQYWAGLVIMGDTSAIELKKKNILTQYWWIGALFIMSIAGGWWWMKKKK